MSVSPKVVYFGIPSLEYPRNRRIRAFLTDAVGADVLVCDDGVDHRGWIGKVRRFSTLIRSSRGADVIVLAEFGTKYAFPAWCVATARGARLVVDGFVGLHETHIEDGRQHSARSPAAIFYWLTDALAIRTADLYLVDTDVRAAAVRARTGSHTTVISLPVGAPGWAVPVSAGIHPARVEPLLTDPAVESDPAANDEGPLRLLYYGNYIALHGLDTLISALADPRLRARVHLTLVGDGRLRASVADDVSRLGLQECTTFLDPVPESELLELIAAHHVVLGILGSSIKAGSVIANKVWQGLACGRYVITRESAALAEINDFCLDQLIVAPPADSVALADLLVSVIAHPFVRRKVFPASGDRLTAYVDERFAAFGAILSTLLLSSQPAVIISHES